MLIPLLFSILLTVYCAPLQNYSQETILFSENINDGSGSYKFSYSTSNGISRTEKGIVVNKGKPNEHIAVRGSYSYLRPDGERERIEYTADEKGFHHSTSTTIVKSKDKNKPSQELMASLLGK